jgi:hypothetical protein
MLSLAVLFHAKLHTCYKCQTDHFCHVVSGSANPHGASTSGASTSKQPWPEEELTPVDLDDEELEAYAEECAQRAALADFDDIPEEELFSWSDFEEPDGLSEQTQFDGYYMDIA